MRPSQRIARLLSLYLLFLISDVGAMEDLDELDGREARYLCVCMAVGCDFLFRTQNLATYNDSTEQQKHSLAVPLVRSYIQESYPTCLLDFERGCGMGPPA